MSPLTPAFRTAPTPFLALDGDDRVEDANGAFAIAYRFDVADLRGRPLVDLPPPLSGLAAVAAAARRSGAPTEIAAGDGGPGGTALPLAGGGVLFALAAPEGAPGAVGLRAAEVLASISDAFFALDREWRFAYVNAQAEPLLDRTRDDLLGKIVWDVFPEAVGTPFWEAYHRAVETGEPARFDAFFDPLGRHFDVRAYPFEGGLSVYFSDVTEAKRAEAALRERTEALEANAHALETVGRVNALLAAELDPERLVQAVTDAGTELTGAHFGAFFYNAPGDDAEQRMLYTISGVPREAFSQFPMPRDTAIFHATFSGEGVVRLDDVLADPRYGKNDPHFGMPEGHLPVRSYLAVPVTSTGGEVVGGFFFGHPEPGVFDEGAEQIAVGLAAQAAIALRNARLYQDLRGELVERERTEAALHTSEERFRHVLLSLPVAVYTTDRDGRITLYNERAAELWGRRPEVGRDQWCGSWRIYHPDGTPLPLDACPMAISLREGRGVHGEEIVVERPDGTRAHVLAHPEPLRDASGAVVGAVNMLTDVTELRRADRARALLAAIVESADEAIVSKSLDGLITSWNAGAERIFGYTAEEAVGQSVLMLIPPERHDEETMILKRLRRGERIEHFETVRLAKGGRALHASLTVSPVLDGTGRIVGASKILRDVTEAKRAEAALRESEERARLALDAARLGMWSWDLETDEGTQDARTQEILGVPREQGTMTKALARVVHPDDLPTVRAAMDAALDPADGGRVEVEWRVPRTDGDPRWVRATAQVFFEGDGDGRRPVRMVGALADITGQKEAERQLLAVVDNLPELAWSARPDGYLDFYNERWYAYTGTTFEEMEGEGWGAVHDPAHLPEVGRRWKRSLETGEPFEMEFPLRGAGGAYRWFLTRSNPLLDADGNVSRWIGVTVDIHEKKRAETQARFLAESGRLAEEALDFDATLDRLADLAVPAFADWCSISLRRDDGSIDVVAIAHADPEKLRWGWELQDLRPVDPEAPTGVPNVIRTGQSELYPDIPDELLVASVEDEEELALLREIGFSSVMIVPMRAGDAVVGAVSFVNTESGRHFDELDLAAAEEVGRRAGAALETARLYRALQRSEAAALEAEARTRALFDATPDVVLVYPIRADAPEPLVEVNEAAVEVYGYTREELLRMRPTELLVPGSIVVADAYAQLRREGTARFETVHRTRDGREIPMEVVAHLVLRDGRETVLSVCRDTTERRAAERVLRERERELHTLANSIPQMAWMAGPSGTILWYNRRWYDYTGAAPGEAEGQDMHTILHPDEADRVAEGYLAAFAAGEPWEDTFRLRGADGEYRWFLSRALPLHDAEGRVARWFGTNTDVTEQRALLAQRDEAVDRLRQSQERHRLALEGGAMGTWEWHIPEDRLDGDERVFALWGIRPGDVETVAAFYARLVHPDDLEGLQAEVARVLAEETAYASEFRVVRPDGHVRWIANRGRVVRDAAGAPVRMFGLSFDVTERREAEETLRRKNTEMEQFAYTISHDLKSPLVTITGFLGVLKKQIELNRIDRALASAERVLGAADRMGRLIDDLLQLSRAGRVTGDPAPVDLDALVGGLAEAFSRRVHEAGGAIEVEGPLGSLLADERRLGEVVENLLANAVTYGLGGGGTRIVVRSVSPRGGGLRLLVEDDGPGVPEAYRHKVFELFQRLDGGGDGTGIGLALVARILEVMGGRACVEGAGGPPGREGARFVLDFPSSAVLVRPDPATQGADARTTDELECAQDPEAPPAAADLDASLAPPP